MIFQVLDDLSPPINQEVSMMFSSSVDHARRENSSSSSASEQAIRKVANVFKLLSDETRLRILAYLAENKELHVSDLCERLGQSQPAVSHHLALLRVSGLIEPRREGKHNFYSVRSEAFGELLVDVLSVSGDVPKKIKFQDFALTYHGG